MVKVKPQTVSSTDTWNLVSLPISSGTKWASQCGSTLLWHAIFQRENKKSPQFLRKVSCWFKWKGNSKISITSIKGKQSSNFGFQFCVLHTVSYLQSKSTSSYKWTDTVMEIRAGDVIRWNKKSKQFPPCYFWLKQKGSALCWVLLNELSIQVAIEPPIFRQTWS